MISGNIEGGGPDIPPSPSTFLTHSFAIPMNISLEMILMKNRLSSTNMCTDHAMRLTEYSPLKSDLVNIKLRTFSLVL